MITPEDLAKGNHPNCCLCGGKTNPHAGNPNLWPIKLCTPDSNGATRPHCTGCVISRVYATPKPAAEVVEALVAYINDHNYDDTENNGVCQCGMCTKARAALAAQSAREKAG